MLLVTHSFTRMRMGGEMPYECTVRHRTVWSVEIALEAGGM